MRPAVATIMSARPWEAAFFQEATAHAAVRMVARLDEPWDLARLAGCLDVVVIGSETPWLEGWVFDALQRLGCGTLGVYRAGDHVGARLVAQSTASVVESTPPDRKAPSGTSDSRRRSTAAVTNPRTRALACPNRSPKIFRA